MHREGRRFDPVWLHFFMYYTYILHSKKTHRFYIGHTQDLIKRLSQHNSGYSKSTKHGIPWDLLYFEEFAERSSAMKREKEIKRKKSHKFIQTLANRSD